MPVVKVFVKGNGPGTGIDNLYLTSLHVTPVINSFGEELSEEDFEVHGQVPDKKRLVTGFCSG